MKVVPMPGDGNCLFHSIAHLLKVQHDNIVAEYASYVSDLKLSISGDQGLKANGG